MAAADAKTNAPKEPQPLGSRSGKRGYIRICVRCGITLYGVGCHTKYCLTCRDEVRREKSREYYLRRKARARAAACKACSGPDVREIAAQADAAGMTYGQYVAATVFLPTLP